jgi:dihydrolipoamide dehydrogenase
LVIAFKRAIIAAGSQAVRLPFMPNYPRVVDSTGALALKEVPKRMLIIGGDVVGQPMLAHKAVHEAHVAAEVIAGELLGNKELAAAAFNARVIPSVAYTDPEVAWVGLTEDQAKAQGIKVKKGLFPWAASGRAIANGRDEGVTKLLFDDSPEAHGHGKILGGGMVGTHAGDMIGEIALAIEMGADAVDIGKTIHPHPTLGESIGMAAEVAHGSCTDLPPAKK